LKTDTKKRFKYYSLVGSTERYIMFVYSWNENFE